VATGEPATRPARRAIDYRALSVKQGPAPKQIFKELCVVDG
jgi:hypothetical protein